MKSLDWVRWGIVFLIVVTSFAIFAEVVRADEYKTYRQGSGSITYGDDGALVQTYPEGRGSVSYETLSDGTKRTCRTYPIGGSAYRTTCK